MLLRNFSAFRQDDLIRRLFKNAGILLCGNVGASALGLVSLALTARALGAEGLGTLVLISTYVLVIDRLINFQSWKALIKYGAEALETGRDEDFKSLLKFGFLLDMGTALAGTVIAASGAWLFGNWQGWSSEAITMAIVYSATILFHIAGAPTAILRLFDRFKLFSLIAVVAAAIKLVGVSLAFLASADLWAFILVGIITDVFGKILLLVLSWRELKQRGYIPLVQSSIRKMTARFPGLWGFVITTNLHSSIRMTSREADVLVIGALLTPAAVGLYKIAKQVASVLSTLNDPLYQSIYPELTKLHAKGDIQGILRLAGRSAAVAGSIAFMTWGLLALIAEPLLFHMFGSGFVEARNIMLLYVMALVIAVVSFPLQPIMLAVGRHQASFLVQLTATAIYFPVLFFLLVSVGLEGAGIAYIIYYLAWMIIMILLI